MHKDHNWKHFEDELSIRKQHLREHITAISAKIEHFQKETSELHRVNEWVTDNIDTTRKGVNDQKTKIKGEVDSIADAVLDELSSFEKEKLATHKTCCQLYGRNIAELTGLLEKAETINTLNVLMFFEIESSLRTSLSLYDTNAKSVLTKQPSFFTGSIDRVMLTTMLGEVHTKNHYEKTYIDSKHIQRLSKFTVTPHNQILGICPVDDSHAWLSIRQFKGLKLVNRECVVKEEVETNFSPLRIAIVRTTHIVMTSNPVSTVVYNLSLHDKKVTTFADVSPHEAYDISISERDEVFVSTRTPNILVLDQSGTIVRKVSCGMNGVYIACLPSGNVAVTTTFQNLLSIIDESGTVQHTWTGELSNRQKFGQMHLCKMSSDKYDRLFVPDSRNNQVYVLPRDGTQATCLLLRRHGVIRPVAVGVDSCGNLWIGCRTGSVHVMRL